jgi:heptosyltransferase-3
MKHGKQRGKNLQHLLESPFRKLGHVLAKMVFSPKKASYPFQVSKGTKILFLRHDVLGDMITTLPLFQLVKKNFPEAEIHILCTKSNSAILKYFDAIDHVHEIAPQILTAPYAYLPEIKSLRAMHFDIIVNCYTAKTSKNGILIRLLSSPHTISSTVYAGERYTSYFSAQSTMASSVISMWDKMFMLGVETFGLTYSDEERNPILPAMKHHEEAAKQAIQDLGLLEKEFIAVNLSVGQVNNKWPIDKYIAYIGHLINSGLQPLLFGLEKDKALIDAIRSSYPDIPHYPFGRELQEIGKALSFAKCAMSPDTGFVHLATSARCPIILLDQKRPPHIAEEWGPYRVKHIRVESPTHLIADIAVESVISATEKFLPQV